MASLIIPGGIVADHRMKGLHIHTTTMTICREIIDMNHTYHLGNISNLRYDHPAHDVRGQDQPTGVILATDIEID